MEDKKKKGRIRYLSKTPNIKSSDDEPLILTEEDSENTPTETRSTTAADGIPIDEKDIKFRAKDIKEKDDSKMFVKIEGAKRLERKRERAAKKKDEELIKRLQTAANKRKKENKAAENEKKAAKRKASRWIRNYKLKKVWKQVVRFRVPIIIVVALAIIIPTAIVVARNTQNAIEQQRIADEQAAKEKLVTDNKTEIYKIFEQVVGRSITVEQLTEITKNSSKALTVSYFDNEGIIFYENGGTEYIYFETTKKGKETTVKAFRYYNTIGERRIIIMNSENGFTISDDDEIKEYASLDDLAKDYIPSIVTN